jgi:ATP-binding protein involved in chromosome partitioning
MEEIVRIAIPMSGDLLEQHFGYCEKFVLLDVDAGTKKICSTTEVEAPEHQPGLLPRWLKERDVTLIIAGGMGSHARSLCEQLSIQVVAGASADPPMLLAQHYLDGTLATSDHACSHH